MGFPRPKRHRHSQEREWRAWLTRFAPVLRALGLPPGVMLSEDHWTDFLQNGYLERHPEAFDGFTFNLLSSGQMSELLAVLEASPKYLGEPMTAWVRHRLGRAARE